MTKVASGRANHRIFDLEEIRSDFPGLAQEVHGRPLCYLDNAATAQKPQAVIDAVVRSMALDSANVHRGVHALSERATAAYEGARETARRFLGAAEARELIFLRGATEGINLVAQSFLRPRLSPGDEILISGMEHHSNIVPWQLVAEATGAKLRVAPITDTGELDLEAFEDLLGDRTRMVAIVHISNALGTVNPVAEVVHLAHERDIPVLLDGAQAAPHIRIDLQELGCDFYVLTGHKLFGPNGIGLLYGRAEHLEAMPPYQGGGEMIRSVSFESTEYNVIPHKFEAGTPHITGAVGFAAAMDYVSAFDTEAFAAHEADLLAYATERLSADPRVRILGQAGHKAAVISFLLEGVHPHDIGTILDREGIAVRAGHHCAQPVMDRFGVAATARASFSFYNTRSEVDRLIDGVSKVLELFG